MSNGYPILLDVSNTRIFIFGGGVVAMRKVRGLIEAGAKNITVISPEFHEQFPGDVIRVTGFFDPQHLHDAQLVFAATNNPQVNAAIVAACEQMNLWVNRADAADEHTGNFSSLASRRMGSLLVGVSAGGNPAISAAIRDELADHFQPHWAAWINAVTDIRALIIEEAAPGERQLMLKALASPEASDAVAKGGEPALRLWFNQKFAGVLR